MLKINYGYIYKTTNLKNNKIYIGKHKGKFDPNYFGSGKNIKYFLNIETKDNFKVECIIYAEDKIKLDALEKYYIKEYRRFLTTDFLYNISNGGGGGPLTQETKDKIGKANAIALKGKPLKHKVGCICFICKAKRGETKDQNLGIKNGMYGKRYKHKQETIDKIKKTKAEHPYRHNKERIEKIRQSNNNRREELRLAKLGTHHDEKMRLKISVKTKEAMWTPEVRKNYLEGCLKRDAK